MARYDYECNSCGYVFEVNHPMSEEPKVNCEKCKSSCLKLISCGISRTFFPDFVDYDTTGKPLHFTSYKAWDKHCKKLGLYCPENKPMRPQDLESRINKGNRKQHERLVSDLKSVLPEAMRDKNKWLPKEQFYRRSNG